MLEYYIKAGEIAQKVKERVKHMVKPGVKILDICDSLENYIRELGGEPAFPLNVSVNEIAAHRTALLNDMEVIPNNSLVKVDIGVHYNGFIADTAITISFNPTYDLLLEATKEALEKALKIIKPGVKFSEVGRVISSIAKEFGFKVIKNLSGHNLGRYLIHAGESIPNYYDRLCFGKFKDNSAYAIEPFLTTGFGLVKEMKLVTIYSLKKQRIKGKLSSNEIALLKKVNEKFKTLPFTERWLTELNIETPVLRENLNRLTKKGFLHAYPVLTEVSSGVVAQFEETVVIHDGEVNVITKKV